MEAHAAIDATMWRRTFNEVQALYETAVQEEFAARRTDDPAYLQMRLARALRYKTRVERSLLDFTAAAPGRARCEAPLAQRGDHVVVDYERGLPAETDVVEVRPAARAGWFVVECRARTGRMHQIRAHLAELGAPLVGDARYGGPDHDLGPEVGFFLHAAHLEVPGLPPLAAPPPPGWPG